MNRKRLFGFLVALFAVVAILSFGRTTVTAQQNTPTARQINEAAEALPQARPGQCYAKVMTPAAYKSVTENVVVQEAAQKYTIVPAKYKWAMEKVLVKEASKKLVSVPAVFEKVTEKVEIMPAKRIWRTGPTAKYRSADRSLVAAAASLGLSNSAKPGACYSEYIEDAKYKTETVKVTTKPAADRLEIVPAKYEWVEEKVLLKPAATKIVEMPAVYETVTEKVMEAPATTTWKVGRGPVERIDNSTGDIMCMVEVPAKYKTVTKKVLKTPATTKKEAITAQYKTVRKQKLVSAAKSNKIPVAATEKTVEKKVKISDEKVYWRAKGQSGPGKSTGRQLCAAEVSAKHAVVYTQKLKTPATTKVVDVPATYTDMKVRKLVSPATEKLIPIPAKSQAVSKRVKVADGRLEWQPVLCETNISKDLVTQIQRSLKTAGYQPGPIDGILGAQTMAAVGSFQKNKGLARGGLTLKTLEKLGVRLGG